MARGVTLLPWLRWRQPFCSTKTRLCSARKHADAPLFPTTPHTVRCFLLAPPLPLARPPSLRTWAAGGLDGPAPHYRIRRDSAPGLNAPRCCTPRLRPDAPCARGATQQPAFWAMSLDRVEPVFSPSAPRPNTLYPAIFAALPPRCCPAARSYKRVRFRCIRRISGPGCFSATFAACYSRTTTHATYWRGKRLGHVILLGCCSTSRLKHRGVDANYARCFAYCQRVNA